MTKKIIYSSLLAIILIGCGEDSKLVENNQNNEVNEISLKIDSPNTSKKVDIKYLHEDNIKRLISFLNQNGYASFSQKHINTIYSDFDKNGQEFYIITFNENGYIVLNPNSNANAIYALDANAVYSNISQMDIIDVNIDWMSIIADEVEIPFEKLRKSYQKTGDRKLITKVTWTSNSSRTDFDLYVVSPDGQKCNWESRNRNKEDWGTIFLKDDQGEAYRKSYEAFSVDLDKMDEYANKNNLLGRDNGKYKFYIARYTGANINYKFSYGLTGECSASNSNDCPKGNWVKKVNQTGENNARYAVHYQPKRIDNNPYDDHGNNISSATTLSSGRSMSGTIEQFGDKDYFKIILKCSTRKVNIYTTGNPYPRIGTYGKLFNSNHVLIRSANGYTSNFKIKETLSAGTYYIAVSRSTSNTKNTGNYNIAYNEESTCNNQW